MGNVLVGHRSSYFGKFVHFLFSAVLQYNKRNFPIFFSFEQEMQF